MQQAASSVDVLSNTENIKILSNVLKTNVAACTSIGPFFTPQIGRNYMDMLGLYRAVSGLINESIAAQGDIATKTPKVRSLRTIKKEILKLVETYIKKAEEIEEVNSNLIPALLDAVLGDYLQNIPQARDAEVLNVMATIVSRLGSALTEKVPAILAAVFECTLTMITQGELSLSCNTYRYSWLRGFCQTFRSILSIESAFTACYNTSPTYASLVRLFSSLLLHNQ